MSALQRYAVYSLNAKTGVQQWSDEEPSLTTASAVSVYNGTLFYVVAARSALYGGGTPRLKALNATTGELKWQIELGPGTVEDRPVAADGHVFVILSASYDDHATEDAAPPQPVADGPGSINGSCRVYGCGSYRQNQTCQCNSGCREYGNCCPDYCSFCPPPSPPPPPPPKTFLALSADTGLLRWSTNASATQTAPTVANGLVYVTIGESSVYAYNATTGVLNWTARGISNTWCAPTVADGLLYVAEAEGRLHAVDAMTGTSVWNRTFDGYNPLSPVVANGIVYISGAFDTLYAFDAKIGAPKWNASRLGNGGHLWNIPTVSGDTLYIGADDGHLHALSATTGAKLWNFTTHASVRSPAVANGLVYFGINSQMSPGSEDQLFALET